MFECWTDRPMARQSCRTFMVKQFTSRPVTGEATRAHSLWLMNWPFVRGLTSTPTTIHGLPETRKQDEYEQYIRLSMSNTYVHRDHSRSVRDEKDLVTMENIHYMSPETTSSLLGTKMTGWVWAIYTSSETRDCLLGTRKTGPDYGKYIIRPQRPHTVC